MTSLADQLIRNNEIGVSAETLDEDFFKYDLKGVDEYGLPRKNRLDYIIARIFIINSNKREKLHLRDDGHIWEGDHWLAEDQKNLYRLAEWEKIIDLDRADIIWAKLRSMLPELSDSKLVVKDNLIYDMENRTLEFSEDKPYTIN